MKSIIVVIAVNGMLIFSLPASAAIQGTTGDIQVIAPPSDVTPGQTEFDGIVAFVERQNLILENAVALDITVPGTSPLPADPANQNLSPGTHPSGTAVDSYYLHFDPIGFPPLAIRRTGSITFTTNILGLILIADTLEASNGPLGFPGTLYSAQQVDLTVDDIVTLSADLRTVAFDLKTSPATDNLRVVTEATVPEPLPLILLSCGVMLMDWRRLRPNR